MKRLQLLFLILVSATFFSSCTVVNDDPIDTAISLRELLEGQDLWVYRLSQNGRDRKCSVCFKGFYVIIFKW